MGFLDSLLRAVDVTRTPNKSHDKRTVPFVASITAVEGEQGLLTTEDGEDIPFSCKSCRGFVPKAHTRVLVRRVTQNSTGSFDAVELEVISDAEWAHLCGLAHRKDESVENAAANSHVLGWATVLMSGSIGQGTAALDHYLSEFGFDKIGISYSFERGQLIFDVDDQKITAFVGRGTFPRAHMDTRLLKQPFQPGFAFIGLAPTTNVSQVDDKPSLWSIDGPLRAVTRLALALLSHGEAVVLNRAGGLAVDKSAFLSSLGDIDSPDSQPFAAWLDIAYDEETRTLRSYGMELFGLPDIEIPVERGSAWDVARKRECALYACKRMVDESRPLDKDELVDVPMGYNIMTNTGGPDVQRYAVVEAEDLIELKVSGSSVNPDFLWAIASKPKHSKTQHLGVGTYQAIFRHAFSKAYPGDIVAELVPDEAHRTFPQHTVEVRHNTKDKYFTIVTNGIGRLPQRRRGCPVEMRHVELFTRVEAKNAQIASLVSALGRLIHTGAENAKAWKPGDTVRLDEPQMGLQCFILAAGPALTFERGANIQPMWVIPMTPIELNHVRKHGSAAWLAKHVEDANEHKALIARWKFGMH